MTLLRAGAAASLPRRRRSKVVTGPICTVEHQAWRANRFMPVERALAEETAGAFTYNGTSYAVMMATPQDLEDFAVGFSLTEGIIGSPGEIDSLEAIEQEVGIELRMRLAELRAGTFHARRRYLAGPTGCGLCGIESLGEAMRAPPRVADGMRFSAQEIMRALQALDGLQDINRQTRAVHGAAFYRPTEGVIVLREDVGRHNALDKLCGALARAGISGGGGFCIVTSRLSIEMIQKAAMSGISMMIAISAPTELAVRTAQAAGMTLAAVARSDGFEIFTHPRRIKEERSLHVVAG
jgi:FdhD protein